MRRTGGSIALEVLNGPAGYCLDADPRKHRQAAALPSAFGVPAVFLMYSGIAGVYTAELRLRG